MSHDPHKSPIWVFIWAATSAALYVSGDLLTKWLTVKLDETLLIELMTVRIFFSAILALLVLRVLRFVTLREYVSYLADAVFRTRRHANFEALVFSDKRALLRGFMLALTMVFFALAFKFNNMSEVYVVAYLSPILVMLFGYLIFGETIYLAYIMPIAFMLSGAIAVKLLSENHAMRSNYNLFSLPSMYGYATMLCYAWYCTTTEIAEKHLGEIRMAADLPQYPAFRVCALMTASAFVLAFILLAPVSIGAAVMRRTYLDLDFLQLAALTGASMTSVAGIFAYTMAVTHGSAAEATPYGYLEVVLAAIFEYLIWGRSPTAAQLGAGVVVIIGALLFAKASQRKRALETTS